MAKRIGVSKLRSSPGQHRQELVLAAAHYLGGGPGRLVLGHDLRLLFAQPTDDQVGGDLSGHDRQQSQVVIGVDFRASNEEHTEHAVEPDERDRQVRGRGPDRDQGAVRGSPVGAPAWLVGEEGQEAPQDPAHTVALLGGVRLDHEPRRADGRRVEEAAAVIRHDTAQQPQRAPESRLGIERPVEALRDVVKRTGD